MATRAAIVRLGADGSFAGRYHHWDGYPRGLGAALFDAYRRPFQRDLGRMLKVLIDDHPAGWSNIVGANWRKKPGFLAEPTCAVCKKSNVAHLTWPAGFGPGQGVACTGHDALGHAFVSKADDRPSCYCHGARHEQASTVTESTADGLDYVYGFDVVDGRPTMFILAPFGREGSDAEWGLVRWVDLDGPEPDWSEMDAHVAEVAWI